MSHTTIFGVLQDTAPALVPVFSCVIRTPPPRWTLSISTQTCRTSQIKNKPPLTPYSPPTIIRFPVHISSKTLQRVCMLYINFITFTFPWTCSHQVLASAISLKDLLSRSLVTPKVQNPVLSPQSLSFSLYQQHHHSCLGPPGHTSTVQPTHSAPHGLLLPTLPRDFSLKRLSVPGFRSRTSSFLTLWLAYSSVSDIQTCW